MVFSLVLGALLSAYVGITLYRWFLLPVGAPALSIGQLYGVIFFIKYLLPHADAKESDDSLASKLGTAIIKSLVIAGLYLGLGWLAHTLIY